MRKIRPRSKAALAALGLALLFARPCAAGTAPSEAAAKPPPIKGADVAKADAARKKPLRRCDELPDKAQVECLQKAREQIVEARKKREASPAKPGATGTKAAPSPKQEPVPKTSKQGASG